MSHVKSDFYHAPTVEEPTKQTDVPALWWRWLLVVCDLNIMFGSLLVIAPKVYQDILGKAFYESLLGTYTYASLTALELQYQNWLLGVLGGVLIGWSLLIGWVTWYSFRKGEQWAWTAIAVSLIVWFLFDTYASIRMEVYLNVIVNLGYLIGFGVPLLATRAQFSSKG